MKKLEVKATVTKPEKKMLEVQATVTKPEEQETISLDVEREKRKPPSWFDEPVGEVVNTLTDEELNIVKRAYNASEDYRPHCDEHRDRPFEDLVGWRRADLSFVLYCWEPVPECWACEQDAFELWKKCEPKWEEFVEWLKPEGTPEDNERAAEAARRKYARDMGEEFWRDEIMLRGEAGSLTAQRDDPLKGQLGEFVPEPND